MKTNAPPGRRKFAGVRDEMEYLYHKLLYWLYEREEVAHALVFAERLARLVSKTSPGHEAIFPEECWSLIWEARGNLPQAIKHRENEVRLIKRLHEISRDDVNEESVLRLYGYDDLSDRLDLLAVLLHDNGDLNKALAIIKESQRLCQKHGIKFDGEDILQECLEEKSTRPTAMADASRAFHAGRRDR